MALVQHLDFGMNGSEFVYRQKTLKSDGLFTTLLAVLLFLAFSLELHMMDQKLLTVLCLTLILILLKKLYSKVYSESVLILPSLGIQVKKCFFLGRVNTNFIHLSHIKDIVINESISMQSVIYYLLVLLRGQTSQDLGELYPLFCHSCPSVQNLIQVYQTAQKKLQLKSKSKKL